MSDVDDPSAGGERLFGDHPGSDDPTVVSGDGLFSVEEALTTPEHAWPPANAGRRVLGAETPRREAVPFPATTTTPLGSTATVDRLIGWAQIWRPWLVFGFAAIITASVAGIYLSSTRSNSTALARRAAAPSVLDQTTILDGSSSPTTGLGTGPTTVSVAPDSEAEPEAGGPSTTQSLAPTSSSETGRSSSTTAPSDTTAVSTSTTRVGIGSPTTLRSPSTTSAVQRTSSTAARSTTSRRASTTSSSVIPGPTTRPQPSTTRRPTTTSGPVTTRRTTSTLAPTTVRSVTSLDTTTSSTAPTTLGSTSTPRSTTTFGSSSTVGSSTSEASSTTTGSTTTSSIITEEPTRVEAESGVLHGTAAVRSDHPGFSGEGFVGDIYTKGSGVSVLVRSSRTGMIPLTVGYSAGRESGPSGSRLLTVYVDGRRIIRADMAVTESWSTWDVIVGKIPLERGRNRITLIWDEDDTGWANLDYIEINSPPPTATE